MRSKKRMGLYFVFYVAAALCTGFSWHWTYSLRFYGRRDDYSTGKKEDASALPKYIEATDSKLDGFAIVEPIQKPEQLPQLLWLLHML